MTKIGELLKELTRLNLPKEEYVIVGSGPLGIRGIRESNDLDILVTDKPWERLEKVYGVFQKENEIVIKVSENIEALGNKTFPREPDNFPTITEQINEAEFIEDFSFQSIKHLKFFKGLSKREKDLVEIVLLDKWLNKNSP